TGPGVSDHNIARLFEPLFTTKQVGTGLGLTSCKKIVSNHGGKISFKNNPTTFTITLPK
ncbi:MAG TPA: HAMP domain-containing sensor histidine kinase, partial [Candidatus Nitrosotenuis sp.]|nr:HAMP domain-containing sensor histidine kinase [Candidatus Nitrosotenuis sp.]